jgi:hypothetical protein
MLRKVVSAACKDDFRYFKIQQGHKDGRGSARPERFIPGRAITAYVKIAYTGIQGRYRLMQQFTPVI